MIYTRSRFTRLRRNPLLQLTDQGRQRIDALAQRYSVSADAAMALLQALVNGNGTMAQFNHPELGGSGQWMRGRHDHGR